MDEDARPDGPSLSSLPIQHAEISESESSYAGSGESHSVGQHEDEVESVHEDTVEEAGGHEIQLPLDGLNPGLETSSTDEQAGLTVTTDSTVATAETSGPPIEPQTVSAGAEIQEGTTLSQNDGASGRNKYTRLNSMNGGTSTGEPTIGNSRADVAPAPASLRSRGSSNSTNRAREIPLRTSSNDTNGSRPTIRPSRSNRDVLLPRWQPDAEVTYCPICSTQFSFFVRKHHCRKCGRVVCNSCSPHRITIPYQFIVHVQPPETAQAISATAPRPNFGQATSGVEPTFGERDGGMKVRLCNPCVPDPNTLPPQQLSNAERWRVDPPPTYYLNAGDRPFSFGEDAMNHLERDAGSLSTHGNQGNLIRSRGLSAASGLSTDRRPQYSDPAFHSRSASTLTGSSTQASRYAAHDPHRMQSPVTRIGPYVASSQSSQSRGHSNRHQSLSSFNPTPNPQPHYRSLLDFNGPQPSVPDNRPLPAIPRIPEEDECPVCHNELPSRNLPDFETVRAAHITQCIDEQIAAHSGHSSRPGAYTSNSQPVPIPSPPQQTPATSTTTSALTISPAPTPAPPVDTVPEPTFPNTAAGRTAQREYRHAAVVLGQQSYSQSQSSSSPTSAAARRTGMFPYKATEKDCIDDAECTICLEEFEVGVGMARLECLCRFHRRCIKEWFVAHPGRCPVHQHDGYGF